MSPPELEQLPHMDYWQDKRTLVILFVAVRNEEAVHTADVVVNFAETNGKVHTLNCFLPEM
jgi:ABC-type molybdate transport system ATPase subunit